MGFLRREAALMSPSQSLNHVLIPSQENRTMCIPISLHGLKETIDTFALINSGATGNFIDPYLLSKGIFKLKALPTPIIAFNIDGTPNTKGTIRCTSDISFNTGSFSDKAKFVVVYLSRPQVILGMPWLKKWNPIIDWINFSIDFSS